MVGMLDVHYDASAYKRQIEDSLMAATESPATSSTDNRETRPSEHPRIAPVPSHAHGSFKRGGDQDDCTETQTESDSRIEFHNWTPPGSQERKSSRDNALDVEKSSRITEGAQLSVHAVSRLPPISFHHWLPPQFPSTSRYELDNYPRWLPSRRRGSAAAMADEGQKRPQV